MNTLGAALRHAYASENKNSGTKSTLNTQVMTLV